MRASSCCQILHPAASEGFRGPNEAGSMCSRDLCRKACGHIHVHGGTHTCMHTHVQTYIENCKLYSPLSTPSHKKVKLNGTRPCRSTFPRLSYFGYPKNISLLMARGSMNQERQGSWHATEQFCLCSNLCTSSTGLERAVLIIAPCVSQLLALNVGKPQNQRNIKVGKDL